MSGLDLSDVRVHANSSRPAQLNALAFAQGNEIHLAPGQERHLPHEAWHVVQQRQGRVPPTLQLRGQAVNDDPALEREADQMSAKAGAIPAARSFEASAKSVPPGACSSVVQRAVGFEFEDPSWTVFKLQPGRAFRRPTGLGSWFSWGNIAPSGPKPASATPEKYPGANVYQRDEGEHINNQVGAFNLQTGPKKGTLHQGPGYALEPDGPYSEGAISNRMDLEFVTEPFPETEQGFLRLMAALDDMQEVYGRLAPKAGGEWKGEAFNYDRFVTPAEHQFTDQSIYLYGGVPGGDFKPQVTAGMSLADVPQVMDTLGKGEPGEWRQSDEARGERHEVRKMVYGESVQKRSEATMLAGLSSKAGDVVRGLVEDGVISPGAEGAESLRGFLSLALMYLVALSRPTAEGIKILTPLLSRYSFVTLFGQLPPDVQAGLQSGPGRVALITRLSAAISDRIRGEVKDMSGPMISVGSIYKGSTDQLVPDLMQALGSFTRSDWMLAVLDGKDLLTADDLLEHFNRDAAHPTQKAAAANYAKSIAVFLRGHGNTKNVKDVEGEESGRLALLENRAIAPKVSGSGALLKREHMSFDEAHSFAVKYFAWAYSIKTARDETNQRREVRKQRLIDDAHKARTIRFGP